jgi:hypothetical protein
MIELGKQIYHVNKEVKSNVHRKFALEYLEHISLFGLPDLTLSGYYGRKDRFIHKRRIGFLWESVPPGVHSVTLDDNIVLTRSNNPIEGCTVNWNITDVKVYFSKLK